MEKIKERLRDTVDRMRTSNIHSIGVPGKRIGRNVERLYFFKKW